MSALKLHTAKKKKRQAQNKKLAQHIDLGH